MNVYLLIDLNDPDYSMDPPIPLGVYSTEQKAQDAFVAYYNSMCPPPHYDDSSYDWLMWARDGKYEFSDIANECAIKVLFLDGPATWGLNEVVY